MLYSLLIVAAIGSIIFSLKRWQSLPQEQRSAFAKKALIYGVVGIVLALVLAGRAHWLMGILAALLALASRVAQFAQYVPLFKKIFGQEEDVADQSSPNASPQVVMSKQDAADILGVDVNASADDVRLAHKKLMQKIHPDRGGSDALAKQINKAKDCLLG